MIPILRLGFAFADVRDVADLHIRAMTAPEAAGQRFLAVVRAAGEPVALYGHSDGGVAALEALASACTSEAIASGSRSAPGNGHQCARRPCRIPARAS